MGMLQEFREFAVKGNAMDLAVGVIIGGAFGKIVDSVVSDLIMPLVSRVTGRLDYSNLYLVLGDNPKNLTALADIKTAGIPVFAFDYPGQFCDPRLRHLHDGQAAQPPARRRAAGTRAGSAGDAGRRHAAARDSRFAEEIAVGHSNKKAAACGFFVVCGAALSRRKPSSTGC